MCPITRLAAFSRSDSAATRSPASAAASAPARTVTVPVSGSAAGSAGLAEADAGAIAPARRAAATPQARTEWDERRMCSVARDDGRSIRPPGQHAVAGRAILAQACPDERFGVETRRMAEHERTLQGEREAFGQAPRLRLSVIRARSRDVIEQPQCAGHVGIQRAGGAGCGLQLGGEGRAGLGV